MKDLIMTRETCVWAFLAVLTMISWLIGNKYDEVSVDVYKYLSIAMILLAFFKVRLVVMNFMEVGNAPIPLRAVFETWLFVFASVLAFMFHRINAI